MASRDSTGSSEIQEKKNANITQNYIIIDIGANLTNKKYSRDLDSVITRAQDAGVQKVMVTGINIQSSKEALRLTRIFPGCLYSTAGVHPHEAKGWEENTLIELRQLIGNNEVVAIGECGLDFNRNFSPPEIQMEVFEKQVNLACTLRKPLFIHEREAHSELLSILSKYESKLPSVVIHCFTGNIDQAKAYLDHGFYIGLTGYIWKDNSEDGVRKLLESGLLPLDKLLVETDCPFMYPNTRASKLPQFVKNALTEESQRYLLRYCSFQRNEPCSLPVTIEIIAAYMKQKPDQVALQTTFNAMKVFGLSA